MTETAKDKKDITAKKQDVLEAAERVFSKHGYAAARMEDVAAEAGVSKGSVYNYFKSKQEMFMEVFHFSQINDRELFDKIVNSNISSREKILKIIETVLKRFDAHRNIGKLLMEFWATAGRDEFAGFNEVLNNLYSDYLAVLEELISQGQSSGEMEVMTTPKMSARMLVAFLDGLGMQKLIGVGGEWNKQDYAEITEAINRIMGQNR